MEHEDKQKIQYKKNLDKKYRKSDIDEEKFISRQQKKQFKQKKRQIIEEDYDEDIEEY
jgi:hypothetical protein